MNRTFARMGALLATTALGITLAGAALAQTKTTKKAPAGKDAAAVARGKEIFQRKCSTCHYDTSDAKKIGPGLKGIGKRGTFTVNNNKVTDETLKTWIENGDSLALQHPVKRPAFSFHLGSYGICWLTQSADRIIGDESLA